MNRMVVRIVISHALVAAVGALATFLVVRQLAPALFDESIRTGMGLGPGGGRGQAQAAYLRQQAGHAVDQALVVGALVGVMAAAGFGLAAAVRLTGPLNRVRAATRDLAAGRYNAMVRPPRDRELAELAEDINQLGGALQQTESRRVRLLGEVAHEMRTPLTVIDGYLEGMIDGVIPKDSAHLAQLAEETRRLGRLADDLSALSKADEGRLEAHLVPTDLCSVIVKAVERLRPQVDDAGLKLALDVGEALPVQADPDRIAQVLTNLIGNAVRATAPGGRVEVRCHQDGQWVTVTVRDTGEGLDPADLDRIFERFYRVPDRRRAGQDSGTGIGLTIAAGIARAHGGTLSAASAGRGHGATFTLRLPCQPTGPTHDRRPAPGPAGRDELNG